MGRNERRKRAFEHIARLRRAEREAPELDLAPVREDLERELGDTVSRSLAAQLLGVSHTALARWVGSGDVPVVVTRTGREEVPVPALLELHEELERRRLQAGERLHALGAVLAERRARAARMRIERLADAPGLAHSGRPRDRGHRTAELRGLAYHRALAPRLRRPTVEEARRRLGRWEAEGKIDGRWAKRWNALLDRPLPEIREAIGADTEEARDLRQHSPLAGLLSEPERNRILARVR